MRFGKPSEFIKHELLEDEITVEKENDEDVSKSTTVLEIKTKTQDDIVEKVEEEKEEEVNYLEIKKKVDTELATESQA